MINIEQAIKYLNKNSNKDKEYLIKQLILKFKYTIKKAKEVYYFWKTKFMKSIKCIPTQVKVPIHNMFGANKNIVVGLYGTYKILDNCIVAGDHFFNSIDEIEKYRYFRHGNKLSSKDDMLDEAIQIMQLKGLIVKSL